MKILTQFCLLWSLSWLLSSSHLWKVLIPQDHLPHKMFTSHIASSAHSNSYLKFDNRQLCEAQILRYKAMMISRMSKLANVGSFLLHYEMIIWWSPYGGNYPGVIFDPIFQLPQSAMVIMAVMMTLSMCKTCKTWNPILMLIKLLGRCLTLHFWTATFFTV